MAPIKATVTAKTAVAAAAAPLAVAFYQSGTAFSTGRGEAQPRIPDHSTGANPQTASSSVSTLPSSQCLVMAAAGVMAGAGLLARRTVATTNLSRQKSAVVPCNAFESEMGVQAPVGFWDPLGISKDGDVNAYKRRRATELKHGRVSMIASVGYIVPEYLKFPGYLAPKEGLSFADVPTGLAAVSKVPAFGWCQIFAFIGAMEMNVLAPDDSRDPGDYSACGKLGVPGAKGIEDPEKRKRSLNAELANGRLAMMAIIGMFYQDGLTGSAWGDWSLYTDSPLRAYEDECGVQRPVGFWDPAGYSAVGDAEDFRRRRETELKHGRVSMIACIGYMVPEFVKFPGFLAPHLNLRFNDVPNGLAAFSKVPVAGWVQIVLFCGLVEIGLFPQDKSRAPGDYKNAGALGVPNAGAPMEDKEARKRKLNAELANGRLAMMAIMGMLFQDGLTGSAWGDWALFEASPLRAAEASTKNPRLEAPSPTPMGLQTSPFAGELGVMDPAGFWDPAGCLEGATVDEFKRMRSAEIKHGRLAMVASIGYLFPFYMKLPGYISPTLGVKFQDIPCGLAALSKVPGQGWCQIALFAAFIEFNLGPDGLDEWKGRGPGDYDKGFLGMFANVKDPERRKRSLNAELANGRLAMLSIAGMLVQEGIVGNTGPSMWFGPGAFEGEMGVQAPVGYWDPLGISKDGDTAAFKRRRATELKHGRVSMLACVGYIVPEFFRFPGYLAPKAGIAFDAVPNGLGAFSQVPAFGWCQIFAFIGSMEMNYLAPDDSRAPGDYANCGRLGVPGANGIDDPEKRKKSLNAELANGRLAMMAIIGMFYQDGLTGTAWGDWGAYVDSPLRAYEDELGVQRPIGFWDPANFCAEGTAEDFKRRRATEIKHGRVSMIASIGYIAPEFFRWPGDCAPHIGLKFTDIPNGLGAFSKVPVAGWVQMFLFCGLVEKGLFTEDASRDAGDFARGGCLGVPNSAPPMADKEARKRKLSAEIANGRLAMMSIIGMFFQDGLTGSAWGDWALFTASPLRAFESDLGVQAPLGFWDPVGYTQDGNMDKYLRRRSVEIKHGRVSMYATLGYIVPEYAKFPGFISPSKGLAFADIPNGLAAFSKVPGAGWAQMVAFCGLFEISYGDLEWKSEPGNYGKGFLGVFGPVADPEQRKRKLNAEIANGRLAMVAIIGMFFQDGLTGSAWGDWALYTDSPLRAFETELGVQAPVGFWDPAAFCADGNTEEFARRRATEIKHGRLSMLACMGYITPEITGKFPGMLSPSQGLSFEDIPNGLAAISKIPLGGWTQIFVYCAYCEISQDQAPGTKAFEQDFNWKVLSSPDPEKKRAKLAAEIANGRLAMVAIIGMFFQDGLTGTAWGDWALYTDSPLRAFESELGVQEPVGFWDPLGLSSDGDVLTFKRRRHVELKHGRICMLATMGYITPEITGKFPGYLCPSQGLKFADIPNGLAAVSKIPALGWVQIVAYCGYCEVSGPRLRAANTEDYQNFTPGDYGWKLLTSDDPAEKTKKLAAEIANSRLAMVAILGMFFQDGLTGSAWGDWANYTDSPLRAFEDELGVQAPLGFWDPIGYTQDGNMDKFKRRRSVELKHGRVSMYATIGYIVPEYVKWPGFLSPSKGLSFEEIPNGLAAFGKVPAVGWAQMVAFVGCFEIGYEDEEWKKEPGNYGKGFLGLLGPISDPEKRKKKLNAEIANGRLAMVAIIGMFYQDGLTGSAWGDWALYTDSPLR